MKVGIGDHPIYCPAAFLNDNPQDSPLDGYLKRLRRLAGEPERAVLGRPVFFVDGEPERDAAAQAQLEACARAVGFRELHFQYEPIAAAFDFEQQATTEQIVLVGQVPAEGASVKWALTRMEG